MDVEGIVKTIMMVKVIGARGRKRNLLQDVLKMDANMVLSCANCMKKTFRMT